MARANAASTRGSCDCGTNIELGARVFFNFTCIVLEVCPVRIGDFSLFGPAVGVPSAIDAELPIPKPRAL